MSILEAVVLGAVQGLTEFIPISSSGHLVVVPELLGWEQPGLAFDVLLHVGSLLALLVYFRTDLLELARGVAAGNRQARRMVAFLAVGTIPAAVAGVLWGDYFERSFRQAKPAALQLLLTAAILVAAEVLLARHTRRGAESGTKLRSVHDLRAPDAVYIGIAQAVSILPGISRSGSTIGMGLALAMKRDDAARFAFLLSIPALFGAAVLEVPSLGEGGVGMGSGTVGVLVSLATSYLAIAGLIRYLKSNTLHPFAAYCVVAGIVFYVLL